MVIAVFCIKNAVLYFMVCNNKIPIGQKVEYFMRPRFLMYLRGFVFLYMNNKKSLGVKSCIFCVPLKFGIKTRIPILL